SQVDPLELAVCRIETKGTPIRRPEAVSRSIRAGQGALAHFAETAQVDHGRLSGKGRHEGQNLPIRRDLWDAKDAPAGARYDLEPHQRSRRLRASPYPKQRGRDSKNR